MKQELGNFPELNFAKSARIEDLAVRCFAYKDVWRAVCTRRSTLLKLSNTPDPRPPALVEDQSIVDRRTLSLHLGLPVDLLLCFADTANLIVEASTLAPHIVQQRGLVIKARIEGWAPDATLAREASNDSASYITDLASQEMWRHVSRRALGSSPLPS